MIKRFTSLLLIVLLSCQCLVQLGMIGYFQLNREYIAAFLCINREKPQLKCEGRCFLKEPLINTSEQQQSEAPAPQKQQVEIPAFLLPHTELNLAAAPVPALPLLPRYSQHFISSPHHSIFHPPRV